MKRITLIIATLLLAACVHSPEPLRFCIEGGDIVLGCEGGREKLTVISSEQWTATTSEPWVMLSPANGIGRCEVSVIVDTTLIRDVRHAVVNFISKGSILGRLELSQSGYGNIISIDKPSVSIDYFKKSDERVFTSKVISNVDFKVVVEEGAEWLSVEPFTLGLDTGSRPRSTVLTFHWSLNREPLQRTAIIRLEPIDPTQSLESPTKMTVTQEAAPRIEDSRAGDSLAVVLANSILGTMAPDDPAESMTSWTNVALWDATDKDLPCKEAIGRVKAARFYMFSTDESIPQEISHLRYVQTLDFYSNENNESKNISLGSEICSLEHLKYLEIGAYGLTDLPSDFVRLGSHLQVLDLNSNCFQRVPEILSEENFPALRSLNLSTNRRISYLTDLRRAGEYEYRGGAGLYMNTSTDPTLERLLKWSKLENLGLSFNCIEGTLPDFEDGSAGFWSKEDVAAWGGDTLSFLAAARVPKILPNAHRLMINLNFFTGNLPRWLLYHPRLMEMDAELLIFNQQEYGRNSRGELVRFDNVPADFEYYFEAFPLYRAKYSFNDLYEE